MSYKLGSACKYMEMMGLSWDQFDEAFNNVDNYNAVQFPNLQDQKSRYEALCDSLQIGKNNVTLGELGQKLMKAHSENDTELANSLMAEINAINQQNELLKDNVPRHFIMQELEAGAQSLPFTGAVAAAGVFGNFIAPGVGTAASFATGAYLAAGAEYVDMIANGSTPETARTMALISGGIEGLIEANLGITKGIVKGSARLMGKEVAESFAKNKLKEIEGKVLKRVHFGPVKKNIVKYLERRAGDVLGEGAEEFWQETTSIMGKEVAAALDGYDIPNDDLQSIVKQTTDAFKGGVLGALGLGLIPGFNPARLEAYADFANVKIVRDAAESIPSEEMFKNAVKDNPIFKDMSEEQKNSDIHDIWQNAQLRNEQRADAKAREIAEVQDAAEGSEELKTGDEEGEEASITQVTRDEESGKLYTKDEVYKDSEGNETGGLFVAGNENNLVEVNGEKKASRIGYIDWEWQTKENGPKYININAFKMGKGREGLRAELFNDFAIQHPGVDIQWNTKGSEATDIKKLLINENPSGAKNGLNYYADTDAVIDAKTRAWVDREIDKNIYDVRKEVGPDGKEHLVKTKLTKQQRGAAIALLEAGAKRMGMSITEYVNKTFGNRIFGSREDFEKASLRQNEDVRIKAGGVRVGVAQQGEYNWKKYGQQVKAVIYAGEHADFSTWAHELAHIFQNQLDGKLKEEAEKAFNVVDGDWEHSMYTFKDGTVKPAIEAFAYGFQDWLKTGKAENEQMRNIFQKFAEFVARAYNSLKDFINLTPEITSVYEQLLAGDDSLLKAAEMAVEAEDRRYRAQMQKQAQEAEQQKQAEAEQQKKSEEAEREEASESTDFTEEQSTEEKLADAENRISEATNETEKTDNAIDNALENTNLTDEQKEQIAETLKDESSTVVEKAEAATEAAESAYDDIDLFQDEGALLSQLIGEPSIRRMIESEFKKEIADNLIDAKELDADVKRWLGYTDEQKAAYIKSKTGWEKNPKGEWKYETDDSINTIIGGSETFKGLKNDPDYLKKKLNAETIRLADVLDAPVLYGIVPFLKSVNVEFINDPIASNSDLGQTGIIINTHYLDKIDGERGLKGLLAREIQHVLQAIESARTVGGFYAQLNEKNAKLNELYRVYREAKKAKLENKEYDKDEVLKTLNNVKYDKDEIEARNVARRVLLKAWERSAKTMESTEDVKRQKVKLLSQEENPDFIEAVNKAQDLLFQDKLTMYGIHNLSEEALRHAVKMGGLANPSMAVVDTEKNSFTNFGEVSLIPYNFMLEKGEGSKGTFGADIYSPRYPSIDKTVTETGQKKVHAIFHAIEDEQYKNELEQKLVNKIENSSKQFDYAYSPLVMAYLAEKGNKDFYKYEKSEYSDEVKDLIKSLGASPNAMAEADNKVILEAYSKYLKKDYEEQLKKLREDYEELKANPKTPEWIKNSRSRAIEKLQEDLDIANETIKELVDEKTGLFNGNVADDFLYRVRHEIESAGKIDYSASEYAARELIENDPDFLPWAKEAYDRIEKEERIFNGFTPSGNRRYLAHTLENVSKYMRQQELQGGESFYYGLGSTRAKFTPNFTTLKQIKKARDRLVTSEEFEKIKEEYNERFDKITEALGDKYDPDVGAARFEEAFEYGKSDPIGYIEKEYGISVDDDMAQEILDFATALRVMPTEYFETKYTRPVELNEFAGAIIPSNLSQDLKDTLKEKGLMIEEYDREAGNREEVTKAALQKFNETRRVLFQDVFHGSPHNFENFSTENIGTGEGAQAFGWGLYFTNQEAIARFYADKLANEPKRISLIAKNEYLKSRKKALRNVENKEKYEAKIIKNINHFKKELKQAQKVGDESEIKFYEGLINDSYEQLDEKERLSLIESFKKDIADAEQEITELKASMKNNRNLYKVDIPNEGYLVWDKPLTSEVIKRVDEGFKKLEEEKKFYRDVEMSAGFNPWNIQYEEYMKAPEKYKGEDLYNYLEKVLHSDKAASLFLNNLDIIGIEYPAHSLSGYTTKDERNYVIFDEKNTNILNHLLFQNAYHGSGADFDKFDTENYGLSGEGSMSFGYGTYVTDNEDIARDYAERQKHEKISRKSVLERTINSDKELYEQGEKYLKQLLSELEDVRKRDKEIKEKYGENSVEYQNFLFYEEEKTIQEQYDRALKSHEERLRYITENEKELSEITTTGKLYTVELPDNGYIQWSEPVTKEIIDRVAPVYAEEMYNRWLNDSESQDGFIVYNDKQKQGIRKSFEEELYRELEVDPTFDGGQLYNYIQRKLEYYDKKNGAKLTSKLLNKAGITGIKYHAGTIHGNGNGAYNYVIFNDDDAKIVDKLLFQTNAELMDEARGFDSWQEFMEYCETFHADDEVSPIPGDADAQWYQTFYETANGVQTEQEKNEEAVQAKNKKEGALPGAVDALFTTMIRSDPEMVDSFLQAVAELDAIDLDSEEWQQAESAEDAAQREQIEKLKDFIGITLSDYNWQTALKRIQGGHEISEGLRKRLIGEMTDSFKARDFRALYSEVMNDPQYAVAEEDSITASLNKKLKKYHDIVKPNDDISRWSPERRKQLAEQLANREIAAKIRSGSLKLDDELDAYIKSLNKQIKETQDQYNELEKETKADYQRIADKERRDLLKLHEQLLLARGKLNSRNIEINRKIAKGLKITDKYSRLTQNLNANYDELFRKYNDLRNTITINAEVQAALDRQEQVAGLREDLNAKQKEKNLTAEVKKMRIQLVKRTMRRVPFNRVDYNNARTVIAIQRMLEPNLLGGVNRFIGIDSPYLRGVISQIVTDSDYKEKILNYLSKNSKASQAFADFKKKLTELKSIKDFDSWTAKDRKAAIRYLPKENWVKDLNLLQLAKEREESIDLDIGMEEIKRTVYDEKTGEPKTYKDKDGNEHNVTETAFKLKANEEIERLVQDAVGADMFDKIVNMPFSEWTTEDLETLAQRIDELYTEGRDLKAAKDEARKNEAAAIRKRIEDAIKETGITINDDDTPEEKERKRKQIEKILGMNDDLKGTEAGKPKGLKARLNRLLHSYADMNVLRFARMLDGQSEGENVRMLYRKEDDCYNAKQRGMNARAEKINKVMKDNNITEGDLAEVVKVPSLGTEFTVDELLYFLAADKDYAEDEKKLAKGEIGLDANDDYAATSRNAVMFGNMMSDMMSQEEKESWLQLDKDMEEALQNDTLTQEQKEQLATGQLDKKPGTTRYIAACHAKWGAILGLANSFLNQNPKFKALMEAIEADYAEQYGRMNEVSINEFNMPVHRVKAYVPLVRRESNGDTNENQVKEDLLGAAGVGKQWADRGMTQRRVQISPLNQKPVQTGLFRTWGDSIERTEHFIAYAPYVRQLNAIYKSRDASYTRRLIESRYGAGAIKYLDEYINEVANPNAGRIRERGAEWLHVLRGKTAPAYLGWKASAIIKQGLTSPWPYMQFVNPAEYVAAAMKFTFNPEMREAIKEKSVFMKMRRMDPVNDLIDEMADSAKTKLDRGWSNFSKIGMQGLELIDWACVAPGWLACYEKKYNQLQNASNARYEAKMAELKERNMYADVGTSEYLTPEQMEAEAKKEMAEDIEAEAVRYADDCTRACQPSNRVTDLAPLFKNSSEAMKAFLQFQTSLNVIWQNLRYDMPYAVKNKEFTRIAGTVIGYVCAGIFMNSVMEGIGGDDDDDETQALRNLIYYSTTQFTDSIPIMGSEITNTMDQLITGKRGFYGSGTDMTPSATKLLSVLTTAKKGNWQKAAELTAEGIGLYLGAPVSGAKEINKLLGKPLSNGDVNLKRGVSDVYGIAGDILEE